MTPTFRELRGHADTDYRYRINQDKRLCKADYDLEALSLTELKLQKDVAKAISTYQDRKRAEARARVKAIAKEMGYSLAELDGSMVKPSRATAAPKYRNPENPSLTWSGRGSKSQWFVEALNKGKAPEDLAIG